MKVNLPKNQNVANGDAVRSMMASVGAATHSQWSRTASIDKEGMANVQFTLPRMFDPSRRGMLGTQYSSYGMGIDLLRFDEDEYVRREVLTAMRNIYKTHALSKAAVDIYSRYPIQGLRLQHKNPDMERFYTELFLEDLDFETFFIDIGRSYWVDGTAFVYGNWSDDLGLWVGEDLIDPLVMDVRRVPFLNEDLLYMVPQQELKDLARGQTPEGQMFRRKFPEMADRISTGEDILMSSDRVIMLANKDRPSDLWGTPTMLRSWNILRLQDRMHSAMQATADRLYAPLVMFTVGGKLPDGSDFIPPAAMLDTFRDNLDAALSSDFRAIVTHSGVQAQEVIRSDRMNNFKQDIDMFDEQIFMAWGLTPAMLKPSSQTYATSALEFQLVTQMLSTYQKMLIKVYNKQAAFVAEAQKHYETDGAGEVIYELREIWDEDANDGEGGYVVKKVPKLSYPKMVLSTINFRDEQKEREFRMQLRNAGIPIANSDVAIGVDIDLEASADKYHEEQIKNKVEEARTQTGIFRATLEQGITVPPDTKTYLQNGITPKEFEDVINKYKDEGGGDVELLNGILNPQEGHEFKDLDNGPIGDTSDLDGGYAPDESYDYE